MDIVKNWHQVHSGIKVDYVLIPYITSHKCCENIASNVALNTFQNIKRLQQKNIMTTVRLINTVNEIIILPQIK